MNSRTRLCLFGLMLVILAVTLAESRLTVADAPPQPEWQWYRGNLHTHSLWSDGNDYPEMIADWYRNQGYHFLGMSDHNTLSEGTKWINVADAAKRGDIAGLDRYRQRFGENWVETRTHKEKPQVRLKPLGEFRALVEERGRFIMIQAEEITDRCGDLPVHIGASNLRDAIKPQGGKSVRETMSANLAAVERQSARVGQPMLAHLNHPNFGWGITAEDMANVVEEKFFEVYNGHLDVHNLGDDKHPGTERMWDIANSLRMTQLKLPPLMALASDDSHNYFGLRGASPGRGWIQVRAKRLTAESLVNAIKQGDFYASSGVKLDDVRYSEDKQLLELKIEPKSTATFSTQFIGTLAGFDPSHEPLVNDKGEPLPVTHKYSDQIGQVFATVEGPNPSYTLTGKELYVRAVVTSSERPENPTFKKQFQQAWTQPVGWRRWVPVESAPAVEPEEETKP